MTIGDRSWRDEVDKYVLAELRSSARPRERKYLVIDLMMGGFDLDFHVSEADTSRVVSASLQRLRKKGLASVFYCAATGEKLGWAAR